MIYQKIILKLSGEILRGGQDSGPHIDADQLSYYTTEIADAYHQGVGIGVVIGGGNIWRGRESASLGIPKEMGDYMGLLATVMNGIALHGSLHKRGVPVILMNRMGTLPVGEGYEPLKAKRYIAEKKVVVLAGGIGSSGCTTDSAATLAAIELEADVCIKGTKVDGVYSEDPSLYEAATFYRAIPLKKAIQERLKVMDLQSLKMCMEHAMKIQVYNATKGGELLSLLAGEKVGTLLQP